MPVDTVKLSTVVLPASTAAIMTIRITRKHMALHRQRTPAHMALQWLSCFSSATTIGGRERVALHGPRLLGVHGTHQTRHRLTMRQSAAST